MGRAQKVVLAYSGGVDTTVCIPYLRQEWGVEEVITLAVDVGQGVSLATAELAETETRRQQELEAIRTKALAAGATVSLVKDVRAEFVRDYALPAIQANALYEGRYPLSTALARPLIAQLLVAVAEEYGADGVAHGCTGKGNDQVRFDVSIAALNPQLKVLAPAREWGMSREQTMAYGERFGLTFPVKKSSPYSIDSNLLGQSIEAGPLEDPWFEPPEEIYTLTQSVTQAPDQPEYVTVEFRQGQPVGLNGENLAAVTLVEQLNVLAGRHGVGRIDMIENRLVGIKSREIYEVPGLLVLITAHQALESMTLTRDVSHYKRGIEETYAQLVYNGLWFSPLKAALDAFIQQTQERVTGSVRLRLFKGTAVVVGRQSPDSLYDPNLATYTEADQFDHRAAEGFIYVWGLPVRVWSQVGQRLP
ncbi:argininosuccinate synthase [Gloeomargarita lithophora Alchichica-D10]|uniref:Argininosuccinate synthase n=1 Tax=Gloeomargarita lithophora Alchichica-D10 TaxID=1188229 RepID=A0A1J0AB78_9CYAN|nr:argininosuccinate synthase [Gloeomargarita lithophora]APB33186.1 argininosuccinate synthase [Gloeomargarita lithophora Alchichica-D10]